MKIIFKGAAGTVTGSRTLVKFQDKIILIDCGQFQGAKKFRNLNWEVNFNAKDIHAVILTHAHIDHSGLLPKLVKDGFRGKIITNKATADLCSVMLRDAAKLQEEDAEFANKAGYSNHRPALPLYEIADVEETLKLFYVIKRHHWHEMMPGLGVKFFRAGHILGANSVQIAYSDSKSGQKILAFSGDIGGSRSSIIQPPEPLDECDSLVLESTYGDRLQPKGSVLEPLAEAVNKVMKRGGVLLVPAFSVGRAQEVLHLLGILLEQNKIPDVPILLDSPMATKATHIFKAHPEEHLLSIKNGVLVSPLENTKYFYMTNSVQESKHLNSRDEAMIIVSSSGMLTGGRIMHHLKQRISDPKNGVLFTGYQGAETKGRLLLDGIASIRIHGEEFAVNAEIMMLDELSGHADQEELLDWLEAINRKPERIFLNHGEENARKEFAKVIAKKYPNIKVELPEMDDAYNL